MGMGMGMGDRRSWAVVVALGLLAALVAVGPVSPGGAQTATDGPVVAPGESDTTAAVTVPAIDNNSMSSVNDAWINTMVPALSHQSGWTGSVAGCNAGTTSNAAYEATFHAINWAREMAGVNQVAEKASMRAQLQETALIMKANGALNHNPPSNWTCWTQSGRDGAAANLSMGAGFGAGHFDAGYGANALMSQNRDLGANNFMVGHRRFNLDPRAVRFGVGFTDTTAAIWSEYDDAFARPPTPVFVPWPSAGYFPDQAEPDGRWSLSVHRDAILASATVQVTPQGGSTFNITPNSPNFEFLADDTVVFDFPPGSQPAPYPTGDPRTYTITVSNIGDENNEGFFPGVTIPSSYTYSVTLFEAESPATTPGVPTNLQLTPANGQIGVSWGPPSSDGGSAITSYRVFVDGQPVHQTANGSTFGHTVTGLNNGQSYNVEVAAVNAVGQGNKTPFQAATPTGGPGPTQDFSDVPVGHPFFHDIAWMADEGISTGFPGTPLPSYRPAEGVTRQSMSAFMYRLAGEPAFTPPGTASFPDVPTNHPFYKEVEWMDDEAITTGFPDSTFKPSQVVTRQAMSAFMHRLHDGPGVGV